MKNISQNLDAILKSVISVKTKYHYLKQRNKEIEVQLSDLKVEADHYKQEIIKLGIKKRLRRGLNNLPVFAESFTIM